jgi:hypothetical protein
MLAIPTALKQIDSAIYTAYSKQNVPNPKSTLPYRCTLSILTAECRYPTPNRLCHIPVPSIITAECTLLQIGSVIYRAYSQQNVPYSKSALPYTEHTGTHSRMYPTPNRLCHIPSIITAECTLPQIGSVIYRAYSQQNVPYPKSALPYTEHTHSRMYRYPTPNRLCPIQSILTAECTLLQIGSVIYRAYSQQNVPYSKSALPYTEHTHSRMYPTPNRLCHILSILTAECAFLQIDSAKYRTGTDHTHSCPVLWIRTHFFRIRIRIHKLFFSDSDTDSDS